ncbi:unnamed protein product [Schistocephalus solidus]|uniref:BPTI/Kunitz inhibitor domain-containing protein n=1 Tax=Schistocephalus solidus TaxID=70667 RepID=A0A3P7C5T1_SCHSO|nr:unnamed protein product [Schistocephalus solidus]
MQTGDCYASVQRFGFDIFTKKCKEFTYGGCGANSNSFRTLRECQNMCRNEVCTLPLATGHCRAAFQRFGFEVSTGKCKPFIYGGCGGNGNNFETLKECQRMCEKP